MFEGDRADDVVLVTDGLVRITKDSEHGYTSVLAVRGPDDLLGELSCLDGGPRSATATATSPGAGVTITAERFRALLTEHGSLALAVLRGVTGRLRDSDPVRSWLRERLYELLEAALEATGVDHRAAPPPTDRGDGMFWLLPGSVPKTT